MAKTQTAAGPAKKAKKYRVEPFHDRVLVKPDEAEKVSDGGIIIPDTVKEEKKQGTVVSIGPGLSDKGIAAQVGDLVIYPKYAGVEVELEGQKHLLLKDSDIFGRLVEVK